tara:strand:- start:6966 stop:10709 length:3744 start_codon:yes stop_codon:yes gene_type:complete
MVKINNGNNLNRILLLSIIFVFGCDNSPKIIVSDEAKSRVKELISSNVIAYAELFNKSNSINSSDRNFVFLDSMRTGINFKNLWNPDPKHKGQLGNSFIAAGVAIGDYNNDGLQDVFLSRQQDGGRLYRNLGEFRFKDVTKEIGMSSENMWSTGASFIDINNDGWLDIYVCGFDSPNQLYINNKGKYKESATEYGLDFKGASVSMSFSDFDQDGDLDAYLLTNRLHDTDSTMKVRTIKNKKDPYVVVPEHREIGYFIKRPDKIPLLVNAGQFDHLYRNDGGKFIDISTEAGIGQQPYYGLSATWWDYNDDGRPDLYVANDYMGPDHLYQNMGPDKNGLTRFKDVVAEALPYTPWFSMGSDYSDINNDGRMDFMASDMAGSNHYRDKVSMGSMSGPNSEAWFLNFPNPAQYMRNTVYLNTGTERFMEVAYLTGLATTDWTWTVKFGDLDNDGYEDVYFTNGMSRDFVNGDLKDRFRIITNNDEKTLKESDLWENEEPYRLSNMVYKNLGDFKFKNVSSDWRLDYYGVSTGSALGDLDGDGDLDIVMNGFDEFARLYRNDLVQNNSIRLNLIGNKSNKQGLGARIEMEYDGSKKKMLRYFSSSRGFMSSSEPVIHFGLGEHDKADRVTIYWPSGNIQILENIPSGYNYTIAEKNTPKKINNKKIPMFKKGKSSIANIFHREKYFDDFKRENLLPNKLSQLGSGVAWGDIDGDGDEDVYIGGASGFSGRTFVNNGSGNFSEKFQLVFKVDADYEDMGSIFIDPDNDGDLDLFVVSGGVECSAGDNILQDRLYLNDGNGQFGKAASGLIPRINASGSVAIAADINKNGKLELFIGGRVVPGSYPENPRSYLLSNSGARYLDATKDIIPEVEYSGMVTSALFSDVDGDSWTDLLVVYEWGPIRFFHNKSGKLIDRTSDVGLADRYGWFNSISKGDVDNDGDTDFIIGNIGYNTKYKASSVNPEILFYGDFDGSGKKNIIEAKFEKDICFPRRGLGCSSSAMPIIKEKFPTYHDFAISSVEEIYTEDLLSSAEKLEVNELASGVLVNRTDVNGNISFEFLPLPRVLQASPVFGSSLCDVNGDGFLDLYAVQNFSGPQRETGYMHGGVSQLMLGDGTGYFDPVPPEDSGLIVPGDATSLTVNDINNDGRADFFVGVNNGKYMSFINQNNFNAYVLKLSDFPKGQKYIGSKIWLHFTDGSVQLHELYAGGGYLSQSAPIIFIGDNSSIEKIVIQWPDGIKNEISDYKNMNDMSRL